MLCHKATTRAPEWIDHIADTVLLNLQYGELMKKKKLFISPSLKYFGIAEKMNRDKKYTLHFRRGMPKNYSIVCSPIPKMWLSRSGRNKWVKYTNN